MNSSVPQSPLASLMMSLGGSIDFSALTTSTDAGQGLSDFSSLLQGMTTDPALLSTSPSTLTAGLTLPAATTEGEGLPPMLPLSVSVSGLTTADLQEPLTDTELLMTQIEQPPALGLRLMPERPQLSEEAVTDDALADDLSELTDGDEVVVVPLTSAPVQEPVVTATAAQATAQTVGQRMSLKERAALNTEQGQAVSADVSEDTADAGLELSGEGDFRPVTMDEDGIQRPVRQETLFSGQQVVTPAPVQSQPAAAAASVAMASVTPETAQAVSTSDVSDMADLQAGDNFEQRLQHQLRERLEFGQDRREWGSALGSRVLTMVADNIQQARIQLDPPELGSLEIKLHIAQDQATIQVQAQNPQVKDVLESNVQRLRDALNEQGLQLAGFDVGTSAQGQQSGGQEQGGSGSSSGDGWLAEGDTQDASQPVVRRSDALLDTFA